MSLFTLSFLIITAGFSEVRPSNESIEQFISACKAEKSNDQKYCNEDKMRDLLSQSWIGDAPFYSEGKPPQASNFIKKDGTDLPPGSIINCSNLKSVKKGVFVCSPPGGLHYFVNLSGNAFDILKKTQKELEKMKTLERKNAEKEKMDIENRLQEAMDKSIDCQASLDVDELNVVEGNTRNLLIGRVNLAQEEQLSIANHKLVEAVKAMACQGVKKRPPGYKIDPSYIKDIRMMVQSGIVISDKSRNEINFKGGETDSSDQRYPDSSVK